MEKVLCKDCKAWERDGADGICCKNAPRPECLPIDKKGYTLVLPRTQANGGCFEGILIEVAS